MRLIITLLLLLTTLVACHNEPKTIKETARKSDVDNFMKDFNRNAALEELEQIDLLLKRYGWPVVETGTGVRYWIYEQGNGRQIGNGDHIRSEYTLRLINGEERYNSDNDGLMDFVVGSSSLTPGMAEAIQLLHEGDGAKIIIPSNLGFGIAGDGNKIPTRSTLIYDIKKIQIVK